VAFVLPHYAAELTLGRVVVTCSHEVGRFLHPGYGPSVQRWRRAAAQWRRNPRRQL